MFKNLWHSLRAPFQKQSNDRDNAPNGDISENNELAETLREDEEALSYSNDCRKRKWDADGGQSPNAD